MLIALLYYNRVLGFIAIEQEQDKLKRFIKFRNKWQTSQCDISVLLWLQDINQQIPKLHNAKWHDS